MNKLRLIPKIGIVGTAGAYDHAYSEIDSLNVTARLNMDSVRLGGQT